MNQLNKIYKINSTPARFAKNYFSYLSKIFSKINYQTINKIINLILDTRKKKNTVFFINNNNNTTTTSHFANDITIRTRYPEKPFKALNLTNNITVITALGNNKDYKTIFKKQLEIYLRDSNLLIAISASDNSPNIIKYIKYAKSKNNKVINLSNFNSGKLKKISDYNIHIPSTKNKYKPVKNLHIIIDHIFNYFFYKHIRKNI